MAAYQSNMIVDIEDYFLKGCGRCERFATADCSTQPWNVGLKALRRTCRNVGLVEVVKWGHPCYMHADRNIAILGAFRNDFRISFFDAALMKDSEAVLEKQGPNTAHADMIRFTANEDVDRLEDVISAYLLEAMGYAAAGIRPKKETERLEFPEELQDALLSDPELNTAFHALTPGRQKSYVLNLNSAKKPATRISRIAKFRDRILDSKGANER